MPMCKDCDRTGSSAEFGGYGGTGLRCPSCGSYSVDY